MTNTSPLSRSHKNMSQLQNRSINITHQKDKISVSDRQNFENLLQGKYITQNRVLANSSDGSDETIRIEKLLGKGGYGEVYQVCYLNNPDRCFALKIPRDPIDITKTYIENEIQKLTSLQRISSKFIPQIHPFHFYWGQEKIPCYFTNIFKPIYNIFPEFWENEPLNPLTSLKLFYLVALGLKHITSHHIVHNDIKPENIMFYQNTPIITDYGTARSNSEIDEVEIERISGRLHGTPMWLPPELISIHADENGTPYVYYNLGKVCQKTDIWGLGLLLMRCLTGKNLFTLSPISTFSTPDIFFRIKYLFTEGNILSKYRLWAKRTIDRLHRNNNLGQQKNLDIDEIRYLLGNLDSKVNALQNEVQKKHDHGKLFSSGRFLTAKILYKKIDLVSRSRTDVEIRDFFIETLFELFDICTAPLFERVKIYRLINTLEQLFPGLIELENKLETPDLTMFVHPNKNFLPNF